MKEELQDELKQRHEGAKKEMNLFLKIFRGDILTEDFVIKQSKLLILIVVLLLLFISNRYACMNELSEIEKLKSELNDIKYENLVIATELTTHSRQSQIEDLLEQKGIPLARPKTPAYEIRK